MDNPYDYATSTYEETHEGPTEALKWMNGMVAKNAKAGLTLSVVSIEPKEDGRYKCIVRFKEYIGGPAAG